MHRRRQNPAIATAIDKPKEAFKAPGPATAPLVKRQAANRLARPGAATTMRWGLGSALAVAVIGCLLYSLRAESRAVLQVRRAPLQLLGRAQETQPAAGPAAALKGGEGHRTVGPWVRLRDASGLVAQWAPLLGHSGRALLQDANGAEQTATEAISLPPPPALDPRAPMHPPWMKAHTDEAPHTRPCR